MRALIRMWILVIGVLIFPKTSPAGDEVFAAPPECLDTARAVLSYILDENTDVGGDSAVQSRWLSTELGRELKEKRNACEDESRRRPDDKIVPPSNNDFLLVWESPSEYAQLGSRRYGNTAFVDFEFRWGPGKNYEGNRRVQSYIFVFEDGQWKLDDVYGVREEYAAPGNLSTELRSRP